MAEPEKDSPLGQAVRCLIDTAGRISADRGFGTFKVTFKAGQIENVNVDRTYRFPDIPATPSTRK